MPITFKPHDYQKIAIDMVIEKPKAGLLLDMGLGKTISSLTAIQELMYNHFDISRVLIIAPLRVARDTWPDEIEKWDHLQLTYSSIIGSKAEREEAIKKDTDLYIINRENVVWLIEQYGKYRDANRKTGFNFTKPWPFDMIIIDELSSFKSQKSKRWKMLKKTVPVTKRVVGLTGTPTPNGLEELWPQIYLLDGGERLGRTMTMYRDNYFVPAGYIKNAHGTLITSSYAPKPGAEDKIYDKLDDICVSMKSKDWIELPERIDHEIKVPLTDATMKKYKELEKEFVLDLETDVIDAGSAATLTQKLHQLSQGAIYTGDADDKVRTWELIHDHKLEAMDELIEEANGKPVLVFYWFKHDAERLKNRYKNARFLDTSQDIKDWNNREVPLLLAHPASAGHGLNLQAGGSTIIWFSMTWSLELYDQANARLHRQGQKEVVSIYHLIAKNTIDERILAALKSKTKTQDAIMEALKAAIKKVKESRDY